MSEVTTSRIFADWSVMMSLTSSFANADTRGPYSFRTLSLIPAASEEVKRTLSEMRGKRRAAQPSGIKTFGSTFKNPDDPIAAGRTAGQLLADAGCNGVAIGGAQFSPKHANFIENTGDATTGDAITRATADAAGPKPVGKATVMAALAAIARRHLRGIYLLARLPPDQQIGQRLVARQAADVRRQDSVAAVDHGAPRANS